MPKLPLLATLVVLLTYQTVDAAPRARTSGSGTNQTSQAPASGECKVAATGTDQSPTEALAKILAVLTSQNRPAARSAQAAVTRLREHARRNSNSVDVVQAFETIRDSGQLYEHDLSYLQGQIDFIETKYLLDRRNQDLIIPQPQLLWNALLREVSFGSIAESISESIVDEGSHEPSTYQDYLQTVVEYARSDADFARFILRNEERLYTTMESALGLVGQGGHLAMAQSILQRAQTIRTQLENPEFLHTIRTIISDSASGELDYSAISTDEAFAQDQILFLSALRDELDRSLGSDNSQPIDRLFSISDEFDRAIFGLTKYISLPNIRRILFAHRFHRLILAAAPSASFAAENAAPYWTDQFISLATQIQARVLLEVPAQTQLQQPPAVIPRSTSPDAQALLAQTGELREDQRRLILAMDRDPFFRRTALQGSLPAVELANPQLWITMNNPREIQSMLESALRTHPGLADRFSRVLRSNLRFALNELRRDSTLYEYYADEIRDSLEQAAREGGITQLASEMAGDPIRLRYFQRRISETNLGDWCGDCTAPGRVNFRRSLSWYYNPSYQIIMLTKGTRFLGKVHIALAQIAHRPAILIDAIEFHPQARVEGPYMRDAEEALLKAIAFLKDLASRQQRELYALANSNSTGTVARLSSAATERIGAERVPIRFSFAAQDIARMLNVSDPAIVRPYYQTMDFAQDTELDSRSVRRSTAQPLVDPKIADFEARILTPAQGSYPELGQLLSDSRDAPTIVEQQALLNQAAQIFMNDATLSVQVRELYSIPRDLPLSPRFFVARFDALYPLIARSSPSEMLQISVPGTNLLYLHSPRRQSTEASQR